jgi:hypothetical protein
MAARLVAFSGTINTVFLDIPNSRTIPPILASYFLGAFFKAGMAAIGGILPMVFRLNQNFF